MMAETEQWYDAKNVFYNEDQDEHGSCIPCTRHTNNNHLGWESTCYLKRESTSAIKLTKRLTPDLDVTPDLELLTGLHRYLEMLNGNCLYVSGSYFLDQSRFHIESLISTVQLKKRDDDTATFIGYFRNALLIALETLRMSVTCAVCSCACNDLKISLQFRARVSLDEIIDHVIDIQDRVLKLLESIQDIFHVGKCEKEAYTREALVVQALLQECDPKLKLCEEAFQEKARSESRVFGALSLSVGAMCIGRLAYAVYENVGEDGLLKAGLWAACHGLTAGVLYLPRRRAKQVLEQLDYHRAQYLALIMMTTPWFNTASQQVYIYTELLGGSSLVGNKQNSGKSINNNNPKFHFLHEQ